MNAALWKALVQGFHSSLIDEINERAPDLRPELGLPTKSLKWALPAGLPPDFAGFAAAAQFDAAPDFRFMVFLLLDDASAKALKLSPTRFWESFCARGVATLALWKQKVAVSGSETFALSATPTCASDLSRLVWIPLGIGGGRCFVGFGA